MDAVASSSSKKDKRDKHGGHHSSKSSSSSSRRHRDDRSSSGSPSPPPVSRRRHDNGGDVEHEPKRAKTSSSSSKHHDDKSSSSSSKRHRHEDERDDRKNADRNKRERSPPRKKDENSSAPSASSNGDASLSIEETNALRAKLGLKPLTVSSENRAVAPDKDDKSGKKTYIDKDTNQEFEHAPARNLARLKEEKELREKLQDQKEKRLLTQKITKAKGLADSDDEDSSDAQNWVKKLKEKEAAQRKAKSLEEMDEQFDSAANDAAVTSSFKASQQKKKEYTANHLKGMRVQHDEDFIKEGQEVILTLQDQYILKGSGNDMDVADDEDVLVNVNVLDQERAAKNLENLKNKPGYKPFDDGFDEDGNFIQRGLLDKYDEELEGVKKKSFKLGAAGTYDASDSKMIRELNEQHKARAIKLDILSDFKVASDYYSQQELEKFKKPKKIRKVLRSKKPLKADDLLPLPTPTTTAERAKAKAEKSEEFVKSEPREASSGLGKETSASASGGKKQISIKDIDFGLDGNKSESDGDQEDSEEDDDDDFGARQEDVEELKEIIDEENNLLDELHSVLNKTRQRITASAAQAAQPVVKKEPEMEQEAGAANGVAFDKLNTIVDEDDEEAPRGALVLDTMSEFCRNLGNEASTSKYMKDLDEEDEDDEMAVDKKPAARGRAKESDDDDDDEKESDREDSKNHSKDDQDDDEMEVNQSKSDDESDDDGEKSTENFGLLEDEPAIDRGLASALKLAVTKGFLVEEKEKKKSARLTAKKDIEAVNYMVEEKNYYDIDDKYNRNRDRFSGPTVDFDEKRNYKPDVKLDYIDEKGHSMNQKEAFRYLSHKFHGKGSGKKKTEKRQKKIQETEAMSKMNSGDTPLNTVALLREKQKTLQQPYVVLSTPKGKNDNVTLPKR